MNHASVVPGTSTSYAKKGSSTLAPEIFSEVDVVEHAPQDGVSAKQSGSTKRSKKQTKDTTPAKTDRSESLARDTSMNAQSGGHGMRNETQQLLDNIDTMMKEASALVEETLQIEEFLQAEDSSSDSQVQHLAQETQDEYRAEDQAFTSSLEKLRQASLALNQFADGLRQQYSLDEPPPEAVNTALEDSLQEPPGRAEIGTSNSLGLHEAVPEKYLAYGEKYLQVGEEGPLQGRGILESVSRFFFQTARQPDVFAHHYANFAKEIFKILQAKSTLEPARCDKRFRDAVWRDNIFYRTVLQTYLAWDKEVSGWVDDLEMSDADHRRSRFLYEQVSALLAPTNSPLNPVAVKRAYQTGGKSVVNGLQHLLEDLRTNHGMPSQVRPDSYEVGKDLACTPGAVVYRSEVLELIQYQMDEDQLVCERPVLVVPPQLNKFYVFDLTPKNSLVNYLKSQGIQPFVISWRNPTKHQGSWDLDCYVSELENAIEVMREVTGSEQINLASACAGGLTSMALLGYLQAANKPLVHSHSLFVTALQADDSFQLGLFASRKTMELSRRHSKMMGYMDGKALSHIFAWLRPTDLVWNYWINNYLLGKEPPSMDVLYWDNDSTRLPAGLHSDFLDIFLEDAFAKPGQLVVKGYPIDIKQLSMDFYCVGGDEDYLMPWKKCFDVPNLLDTDCTFVLSTSGHIQSVLRPPGIANTFYYTNEEAPLDDAESWLKSASKQSGSWWEHWRGWLSQRAGEQRLSPQRLGSDKHPPLSPAPGLYVNEKPQ